LSSGSQSRSPRYEKDSITLTGAVALGSGVMIGAGILAVTGQITELSGRLLPLVFLAAAVVAAFSAYSYARMSRAFPSAGGIAMFLEKSYGRGWLAAGISVLMYLSMVLNESLVARTFGTYALQPFGISTDSVLVSVLAVALLLVALVVNLIGTRLVQGISLLSAAFKIGGLVVFSGAILWFSDSVFASSPGGSVDYGVSSVLGAIALGVLGYKGFTTITNQGEELVNPEKNVGRAIVLTIVLCAVLYVVVSLAVGSQLTVREIVDARDYALAEAARPFFGDAGLWFTVAFAVLATTTGVIISVFAVSRMLAMLTEMGLVPHRHFGMPGDIQQHTVVYTVAIAILLTVLGDLSRLAALGAIVYIIMDIGVHWGLVFKVREETEARVWIPVVAIILDLAVVTGLILVKVSSDVVLLVVVAVSIAVIFGGEWLYLRQSEDAS